MENQSKTKDVPVKISEEGLTLQILLGILDKLEQRIISIEQKLTNLEEKKSLRKLLKD